MSGQITVHIDLNGVDIVMTVTLEATVTLEWMESKIRTTFGVVNGTLSSGQDPNRIEVVTSLRAGGEYYFLAFQVAKPVPPPPPAGKYY